MDASGNVVVCGWFESYSVAFGNGASTLYNSSGQPEGYVARLDGSSGLWQWARRFGGTHRDLATGVAVSARGEVYVTGWSYGTSMSFGTIALQNAQYGDAFLARLSPNGQWQWARHLGTNRPVAHTLLSDGRGGLFVAGNFGAPSTTFGAVTLTTRVIPGTGSPTGSDVFVARLDSAGSCTWAVQGNSTGQNLVDSKAMCFDGSTRLYVTGNYYYTSARLGSFTLPNLSALVASPLPPNPNNNYYSDVFVACVNADTGAWQWAVRAGGAQDDAVGSMTADTQGRVYIAGGLAGRTTFDDPLATGNRAQLAQLDGAIGNWRWAMPLPSGVVQHLAPDAAGQLLVGGQFSTATASFGPVTLNGAGTGLGTGFLARLGASPLSTRPGRASSALQVWPNPAAGRVVQVSGVQAGQLVEVLDVLGRRVTTGQMPGSGVLALPLGASTPAGVYVVRTQGSAKQIVLE